MLRYSATHMFSLLELYYQMVNKMHSSPEIEWKFSAEPILYDDAVDFMEKRVDLIAAGRASECIWLLQHPPLYTAGTSARAEDLLTPDRFPVFKSGRGGEYTYHGPGQRIVYVMLDLNKRRKDVRWFVHEIEAWMIDTLSQFGLKAERREGRVGLWIERSFEQSATLGTKSEEGTKSEDKIAAIGIRLRRWVSFHGMSLNVAPDLEHYSGIVPCGISQFGVTSLKDLGLTVTMKEVDDVLQSCFSKRFLPDLIET